MSNHVRVQQARPKPYRAWRCTAVNALDFVVNTHDDDITHVWGCHCGEVLYVRGEEIQYVPTGLS